MSAPDFPLSAAFANAFAADWIAAWNAHDLNRILSHYAEDFEMSSPMIALYADDNATTLKGKSAVGAYWARALERLPDLNFQLKHVLRGSDSITLIYDGVRGLSAEVFHFGASGEVVRAFAHYDLPDR